MKKFMGVFALVLAIGAVEAKAFQWGPLSVPEMAKYGATHFLEFTYKDFTVSNTNTTQAFTNSINAKTAVQFVGLVLDQAFDTGNTNFTGSCALKIGDGSDDDLFLTSTELASDGTEVYVKFGPPNSYTITPSFQVLALTGTVQNVNVVTNGTATATAVELSRKLYTSAGSIVSTFTPNGNEALADNTSGKVRVLFKLIEWGK